MRQQDRLTLAVWVAVLVLMVLLAGFALGSAPIPELTIAPSASPRVLVTARPASSGPLLTDARGYLALGASDTPATLRRETDPQPIGRLRGQGFIGAISSTGRRVAYWVADGGVARELRVFDTSAPEQDTPLAALLDNERGAAAVWSPDRAGLLLVVEAAAGSAEPFSALRVIDAPTRVIHEIARLTDGSQFWPVGWDRDARLTGACVTNADGSATAYAIVGEDALSARIPMEPGIPARTVVSTGKAVLGVVNGAVIRVWSIASYSDHRELGANAGERIGFAHWLPGGREIAVLVAGRLEVWPAEGGTHRVVARGLPPASDLLVSPDGAVAIVSADGGRSALLVDLASGRSAPLPMAGDRLVAAVSLR